jgi:GTP-binding protein HflX
VLHPLAHKSGDAPVRDPQLRLDEACGLAEALDLDVVEGALAPLRQISPSTFFGAGRCEALAALVVESKIDVIIIDAALSPVQQRNLERAIKAKVIDRPGLILEIFARRARTKEGRLQVELARLGYERSRLVRTWTHLERQRGGLGKTGGPGETQLELDRRMIQAKIERLRVDIEDVRRTRGLQRSARKRAGLPTVVLIGYTNAGKSSLFNRLTAAGVLAKDMPFATLDPTARMVEPTHGRPFILSDTVGFITDLPHDLVAAFRATLEEAVEADLLIHVRDIAHPESEGQKADVEGVLEQIFTGRAERPRVLEAWNKLDLLPDDRRTGRVERAASGEAAAISAATGQGIDTLLAAIEECLFGATQSITLKLDPADGKRRAQALALGRFAAETLAEDGLLHLTLDVTPAAADRLKGWV